MYLKKMRNCRYVFQGGVILFEEGTAKILNANGTLFLKSSSRASVLNGMTYFHF
jgi:hypothetical protein